MRWLGKESVRLLRSQGGFTLLETLLAVAILGFIGTGVVYAIDTNSRASRTLDERVVGSNLATAYLEAIRQLPYDNSDPEYEGAGANITIPQGYIVNINAYYSDDGTNWVDTHTDETLQKISIVILREGGKTAFSICTFRTEF